MQKFWAPIIFAKKKSASSGRGLCPQTPNLRQVGASPPDPHWPPAAGALPQTPETAPHYEFLARRLNTRTRFQFGHLSIVDAPSRAVPYNIAKMQSSKINVALLPVYPFFGMEVWNGIWKKLLAWNGRLLVWNGQKLPVWNVEKSSSIPCHALSATQVK